jgi:chemotaxis protein CheZ
MRANASDMTDRLEERVEGAVRRAMAPFCEELRAFVDRRIAEMSAELNAAVQIVDFSEAALSGQLAGIQDQVARVLGEAGAPGGNTDLELATVAAQSEDAANRILEAAEAISRAIGTTGAATDTVREKLETIFSACEFQDLAGQRIRRAIEHLQLVEGSIAVLASNGAGAPLPDLSPQAPDGPALGQGDVDKLFD